MEKFSITIIFMITGPQCVSCVIINFVLSFITQLKFEMSFCFWTFVIKNIEIIVFKLPWKQLLFCFNKNVCITTRIQIYKYVSDDNDITLNVIQKWLFRIFPIQKCPEKEIKFGKYCLKRIIKQSHKR